MVKPLHLPPSSVFAACLQEEPPEDPSFDILREQLLRSFKPHRAAGGGSQADFNVDDFKDQFMGALNTDGGDAGSQAAPGLYGSGGGARDIDMWSDTDDEDGDEDDGSKAGVKETEWSESEAGMGTGDVGADDEYSGFDTSDDEDGDGDCYFSSAGSNGEGTAAGNGAGAARNRDLGGKVARMAVPTNHNPQKARHAGYSTRPMKGRYKGAVSEEDLDTTDDVDDDSTSDSDWGEFGPDSEDGSEGEYEAAVQPWADHPQFSGQNSWDGKGARAAVPGMHNPQRTDKAGYATRVRGRRGILLYITCCCVSFCRVCTT